MTNQDVRARTSLRSITDVALSCREMYEMQFAHMIDELYILDEMSDQRWGIIKQSLHKYSMEYLEVLAHSLRDDLVKAAHIKKVA